MLKNIMIIFIVVTTSCALGSTALSGDPYRAETQSQQATYIQEPVFNGNIYFYQSRNSFKSTVLLIHGVGDEASDIWSKVVPLLEEQYQVIYLDLPGFGRSDPGDGVYTPERYAALIKWIYDQYVDGPLYLVGHSMGGSIALYYAGAYPQTVQRLVVIDAAGILHRTALTRSMARLRLAHRGQNSIFRKQFEKLGDRISSNLLTNSSQRNDSGNAGSLPDHPMLSGKIFRTPQALASTSLIFTDFSRQIAEVQAPVWLIWGDRDFIAPLRTGKMLARMIPGSRLKIMQGVGHTPMIEDPCAFNQLMLKCLADDIHAHQEIQKQTPAKKSILLENRKNLALRGGFTHIEIRNCRNIKIKNATADRIKIVNSTVEIENLTLETDQEALIVTDSVVTVTAANLTADVGISTTNSRIDLAGVTIQARKAAVASGGQASSIVVFSICKITSLYNDCRIHDIRVITKNSPI